MPLSNPPIDDWAQDGAYRALARLARELPMVDAEHAWLLLERLTVEQRNLVTGALGILLEDGWGTERT